MKLIIYRTEFLSRKERPHIMRKKTRIISMAAAALLAVAPVATGVIPAAGSAVVKADINSNVSVEVKPSNTNSSNTQTSKPADGPYFSFGGYVFGKPDANAPSKNVARTTISIKVGDTVSDVVNQIQKLSIVYHKNNVDSGTVKLILQFLSNVCNQAA